MARVDESSAGSHLRVGPVLIKELRMTGLFSFDDETSTGPLDRVTVVIGRNNSGKSNVLRAVRLLYDRRELLRNPTNFEFVDSERHRDATDQSARRSALVAVLGLSASRANALIDAIAHHTGTKDYVQPYRDKLSAGVRWVLAHDLDGKTPLSNSLAYADGTDLGKVLTDVPLGRQGQSTEFHKRY